MKHIHQPLAATVIALTATLMATGGHAQTAETPGQLQTDPMTVGSAVKQPVYSRTGEQTGQIRDIVSNANGERFVVLDLEQRIGNHVVILPAGELTRQNGRFILASRDDQQLRTLQPYDAAQSDMQPLDRATTIALGNLEAVDGNAVDGASIVVQQNAPTVRVEPGQPQVTVQQPTPDVSVVQPQPEIIVRQSPPTITVDMPQPEIIVRMPEPNVNVSMAQPQVQVRVPEPEVQVVQPEQPQLQIQEGGEAQIQVQQPDQSAQVNIQRATPQVRFERTGEPRVVMNTPQGEPTIRYEQTGEATMKGDNQQPSATGEVDTTGAVDRADDATANASNDEERQTLPVRASQLRGRDVYNLRGNELGSVSDILLDGNGQPHLIVEYGGFLGIGGQRVILPLDSFSMGANNRLVIPGMSEDELRALPAWNPATAGYRRATGNFVTDLSLSR